MDQMELVSMAQRVRCSVDALVAVDLDVCDRDALDDVLAQWRTVRSFTDACEVRIARRSRLLAAEGRSEPAAGVLAQGGLRSTKEAQAAAQREQVCEAMPVFESALCDGAVSTGHVDAIAAATGRLDETEKAAFNEHAQQLVADAERQSVETFARECRELARTLQYDEGVARLENQRRQNNLRQRVDRVSGMHHFHLEVDPESGAKVTAAYTAHLATLRVRHRDDDISRDRLGAQAMVELITGARAIDRRVPEVSVLIDLATMINGLHEASICETSDATMLPPDTARRLCCDAEILPIMLNGDGEVLDLGRSRRTANRAQRRALRAMYRTCGHPDCQTPFDHCQIHHVIWWERFGLTDLDNLIPLCSRHHHLVHEGGWTLTLGDHRIITLTRPDGVTYFTGSTIDRQPATDRPHERVEPEPDRRRRTAA